MKIRIKYISWEMFDKGFKRFWFWHSRKYKYCKGIMFRIFGFDFNITERDATKKLIAQK